MPLRYWGGSARAAAFLALACALALDAQQAQTVTPITGNAPTVVYSFGGSQLQTGNTNRFYYVVVANFVGGSLPSNVVEVRNGPMAFNANSFVALQWQPVSGATTYDVLKLPSFSIPASGSIALATGLASTVRNYNDTGGSLSSYTMGAAPPNSTPYIVYNSRDYTPPALVVGGSPIGSGTGTVTSVTASAPLASSGGVTPNITIVSAQGNGSKVQLSTGTPVSGDCTQFDLNGNTVDSGAPCGGSGSMTWPSNPGPAVCSGTPCTSWAAPLASGPNNALSISGSIIDVITSVVPLLGLANTFTGLQTFSGGVIPTYKTVATLPSASVSTHQVYWITDGASACDSTTGGGSTLVMVTSNGTAWVAPNCIGGAGAVSGLFVPFGFSATGSLANAGSETATSSTFFSIDSSREFSHLAFYVDVAQSTGCTGGPCGTNMVIANASTQTTECQTVTAYTGASGNLNTGTTGLKILTFSSGSGVSGGVCTLPAGTHTIVYSFEGSITIEGLASSGNIASYIGAVNPFYGGYNLSSASGTGSSFTIGSLVGVTYTNTTGFTAPVVWLY